MTTNENATPTQLRTLDRDARPGDIAYLRRPDGSMPSTLFDVLDVYDGAALVRREDATDEGWWYDLDQIAVADDEDPRAYAG